MNLTYSLLSLIWLGFTSPVSIQEPELTFTRVSPAGREVVIQNLPADPEPFKGRFTLFSLSTGKVVPNTDSLTAKWDLGFRGTSIIVNGGVGRKGNAGVQIIDGDYATFDTVAENAPFKQDGAAGSTAVEGGSGNGWYQYDFSTHELNPIKGRFLLLRTAEGKYAKLEVKSYYNQAQGAENGAARYYSFRYFYQEDGSKSLK